MNREFHFEVTWQLAQITKKERTASVCWTVDSIIVRGRDGRLRGLKRRAIEAGTKTTQMPAQTLSCLHCAGLTILWKDPQVGGQKAPSRLGCLNFRSLGRLEICNGLGGSCIGTSLLAVSPPSSFKKAVNIRSSKIQIS